MKVKLAREGVIFAETLEELADITEIALRCSSLPGANMAVLGESGALRGLAFDIAEEIGLDLVDLHDEDSPALRAALPDFVPVSNPLDITAVGLSEPEIYTHTAHRAAGRQADRLGRRLDHPVRPDHLQDQVAARS